MRRLDLDVHLPHDKAVALQEILQDGVAREREESQRTKSAAIRQHCQTKAAAMQHLLDFLLPRSTCWLDVRKAAVIIRAHYRTRRHLTDDEVVGEVKNLIRKHEAGSLDDRQQLLAAKLHLI